MRLRILLVANTLPPHDLSGVGEQVLQLASGLEARGHEVRVLGRGEEGARGPKLLFPLTVAPAVARALSDFRPHVVQVHEGDAALAALWLRLVRGSARLPLLVALQQVSYLEELRAVRPLVCGDRVLGRPGAVELRFRRVKAPLQVALGRWTARAADLVLVPSRATAFEIERDYGVRPAGVLPNVTGATDAAAMEPASAAATSSETLLFVGRLRIRKGVEVLLEAMAELRSSHPHARLRIVGDGEHRAALEARTAELELGERVSFLGRAPGAEVRRELDSARALVVPSTYEGMPLVVLEAMACGRPVVASAVSGIPEVVVDGESGWLVPAEEPAALARALAELLSNPEEGERRGHAGRARVEACYRPRHAAERWESFVMPRIETNADSAAIRGRS